MIDLDTGEYEPFAPPEVTEGFVLIPALVPIWAAFGRLSRGRGYVSSSGMCIPLAYRDIRDECERIGWRDAKEAEDLIAAMDQTFMEVASRRFAEQQE